MLKRFAVLACACALYAITASPASADREVFTTARSSGANGYELQLYGNGQRLYLDTFNQQGGVSYAGNGLASARQLQFDLGARGLFDLSFEPRGEPRRLHLPRYCRGYAKRQRGVWTGTAAFSGENGHTTINADSMRGTVEVADVRCHPPPLPPPGEFKPPSGGKERTHRIIGLEANGPYYIPDFLTERREGSKRASFYASDWEREGALEISSFVSVYGPAAGFTVAKREQRATVAPPPPFSGQASYDGRADPPDIWTGDLAVELPGGNRVALTGPYFEASMYRGIETVVKLQMARFARVLRRSLGF